MKTDVRYDKLLTNNVTEQHGRACAKLLNGSYRTARRDDGTALSWVVFPELSGREVRQVLGELWRGVSLQKSRTTEED